jgi:putative colanic acid biosynthesis glycosyltransferase
MDDLLNHPIILYHKQGRNYSLMRSKLLSIITVNYNSENLLSHTIPGLADFGSNSEVELIMIDGGSTDISKQLIEINETIFTRCLFEKDNGIYDAMNKGLSLSTGEWIWFLNAGDQALISPPWLIKMLVELNDSRVNFIYSDMVVDDTIKCQKLNFFTIATGMINHQAIIYRRSLFAQPYDATLKFCSDYKHLINNYNNIIPYKVSKPLSLYDFSGISSETSRERKLSIWSERLRIQIHSNLPFWHKSCSILVSVTAFAIKSLFPRFMSIKPRR